MTAFKRVAKNTGILYIRMAITVLISLYSTRLILDALGVDDFGIYSLIGGLIAMLGFLNGSLAAATQRFISYALGEGDFDKVKCIFNMSILLHACIAVLVFMILELLGLFIFNGQLNIPEERMEVAKLVYQFMVISTVFTIIAVPYEAVITSHENMMFYAVVGVVESIFKLLIALYISYGALNFPVELSMAEGQLVFTYRALDNLIVYGSLMAALSILMLVVRKVYCHSKYEECEFKFKHCYDKKLFSKISHFAGWSFLGTCSSMVANYGQAIVLNIFFGTKVNSAQGLAGQINGQLAVFSNTLVKALNPMITKSEGAGDRALMLRATMLGSKVSFFLMMFLLIPMLIETQYILDLWLINVPDYTVIFCQLLLMRSLVEALFVPLTSAISAQGNIKKYQISTSIMTLLPLPISYLFFEWGYDPYTLYIIFLSYTIITSSIILLFAKINCQLPIADFLSSVIARCAVSFTLILVFAVVPVVIFDEGAIQFISVILMNTISYIFIVYFIGLTRDERKILKPFIARLTNILSSISHQKDNTIIKDDL